MTYPLLTARLSIEPLGIQDLDSFVRYRQDPAVARFQSWDTNYSQSDAIVLISSQIGVTVPGLDQWLQLAVHDRNTGDHIGDLALHCVAANNSIFELGFTFASEYQGKGFAKEAVSRLIDFLFLELGASKLIANSDRRNSRSIKLLLGLGFEHQPAKSWTEEFKNELVTVDYFEKSRE